MAFMPRRRGGAVGHMATGAVVVALASIAPAGHTGALAASEVDRFAIAHLDTLQSPSFRNNAEYCGWFGYDAAGRLVATPASRGDEASCEPGPPPGKLRVVASYHTHGAYLPDYDNEVPSADDLAGDLADGTDGYVSTPGGRVWAIRLAERATVILCERGCVRADPDFRPCAADPLEARYTVRTLRRRARRIDETC